MDRFTIALFGEAEKGDYNTPYFCKTLPDLVKYFGNPPNQSLGLYFAVQAILYHRDLIFLRVSEEGYSADDYLAGVDLLKDQKLIPEVTAICMPGVCESSILNKVTPICQIYHTLLITTEADLYDYIMR